MHSTNYFGTLILASPDCKASIGSGFFEGALPRPCDVDAESPGVWCARFAAAENTQQLLPSAALTLRVPPVRRFLISVDALVREALFGIPVSA